jgi:FtsP/CotA-like multicopper oxidase with cupredoxin domain
MNGRKMLTSRRQFLALGTFLATLSTPRGAFADSSAEYDQGWRILRVRESQTKLRGPAQPETAVLGYDGAVPGALLRVKRGDELRVRVINELDEPTAVHWHGVRVPNAMDGAPFLTQQPIAAGERFDYRFSPPDAGTFWYHAAADQSGRGLYGPLIVDESEAAAVDRDTALVLDAWRLNSDGSVVRPVGDTPPDDGDQTARTITVNGMNTFDVAAKANERIRLRLINASAAHMLSLRLLGHRADVMAIDGQPSEPFVARDGQLVLAPGSRIDVFFDATLAPGTNAPLLVTTEKEQPLARIVYDPGPGRAELRLDPVPLPPNPLPQRMDFIGAVRRDIRLPGPPQASANNRTAEGSAVWARASRTVDRPASVPLFSIKRGQTAMLALTNRTGLPAVVHIHGHHFRLLDRLDDGWKPFWLDTIAVPVDAVMRVAFVADNPGRWPIESRMLDRPDTVVAGWFDVR